MSSVGLRPKRSDNGMGNGMGELLQLFGMIGPVSAMWGQNLVST